MRFRLKKINRVFLRKISQEKSKNRTKTSSSGLLKGRGRYAALPRPLSDGLRWKFFGGVEVSMQVFCHLHSSSPPRYFVKSKGGRRSETRKAPSSSNFVRVKASRRFFRPVKRNNVPLEGEVLTEVLRHSCSDGVSLYPTRMVLEVGK